MDLIIRYLLPIWIFLVCRLSKLHHWKTYRYNIDRHVEWFPRFTRRLILTRYQRCGLCDATRERSEVRRVAKDWSYPERLFRA